MGTDNPLPNLNIDLLLKKIEELRDFVMQSNKDSGKAQGIATSSQSKKRTPKSPEALRISALFSRKPTTGWSEKEISAFKKLMPIDNDELTMVEKFYETERTNGRGQFCRHDLCTFLNNFMGEVDRARMQKNIPDTETKLNVKNGMIIPNGYHMVK